MSIIPSTRCVKCCFEPDPYRSSDFLFSKVEVFYGITKNLYSKYNDLKSYIVNDEKLRADKFHFSEDRETYILCHGLLRSILSKKLKKSPSEVNFCYDKNNKPGLSGNPLYFNITHVRDAFAFVISKYFYAGIDMERADRTIDFLPIINTFFSKKEREYILKSEACSQDIFFQLWTRKEALLKAIGTGIIADLKEIEVSDLENRINKRSLGNHFEESVFDEHFIYSEKIKDYYLSIAIPAKAEIRLNQVNESVLSYLK